MARKLSINAKKCCGVEKDRLVRELFECDYETTSMEERHQCYRWAAKKSGSRSKQCLISK